MKRRRQIENVFSNIPLGDGPASENHIRPYRPSYGRGITRTDDNRRARIFGPGLCISVRFYYPNGIFVTGIFVGGP